MRPRHKALLALSFAALAAGGLYRVKAEAPAPPLPVVQAVERDTSGVRRLIARFNPGQAEALTVEVYRVADRFGIVPQILAGLICAESSADPEARNGGCYGLGQVRWATWGPELRRHGIARKPADLYDPHKGLVASAYVLRGYLKEELDPRKALYRYRGKRAEAYASRILTLAGEAGL